MSSNDTDAKQPGQLAERVFEFLRVMERLVSEANEPVTAAYWAPLAEYVAVDEFERLVPENAFPAPAEGSGTGAGEDPWSRTVMDWAGYRECFELWASSSPRFESVVQRVAEFPGLVYLEIEEHHTQGDDHHIFNSLSIYEFNDAGKICRIRVAGADRLIISPPR